jgi:hypothetical protein
LIHSRLVLCYLVRKLGWLGMLVLILTSLSLAFGVKDSSEWVSRAEFAKLVLFCLLVLLGLHWGQEQKQSKVSMLMECRPHARIIVLLGEAFGLWIWASFFLFISVLSLIVGEAICGPNVGALWVSQRDKVEVFTSQDHIELRWTSAAKENLGLRVAFTEGEMFSDVNYASVNINTGTTLTLKAMREVILLSSSPLRLPKIIYSGDRELTLVLLEARLLSQTGSWASSLVPWFWKTSVELFGCCVLLILLGKHVSLELGFVVILSIILAQILHALFDEGEIGQFLDQLTKRQNMGRLSGRFEQRWWQEWLLEWSNILQNILSLSVSPQSEADLGVVNKGYSLERIGTVGSSLISLLVGISLFLSLDHWWKRYRSW